MHYDHAEVFAISQQISAPNYKYLPVAVYDGCGIVVFAYWLRLINSCSSHEGSVPFMAVTFRELFGVWGCLVVVFTALLCLCVQ